LGQGSPKELVKAYGNAKLENRPRMPKESKWPRMPKKKWIGQRSPQIM